MLSVEYSSKFKKDVKLLKKSGVDLTELKKVMAELENETVLDPKYKAHQLKGNYGNSLECHIAPDWLLIYQIDEKKKTLYFVRTGTHSNLFE